MPTKQVPLWVIRAVAIIGERVAALTGRRWRPPVTRQSLALAALGVTMDIGKARREIDDVPPVSRAMGLAELGSMRAVSVEARHLARVLRSKPADAR